LSDAISAAQEGLEKSENLYADELSVLNNTLTNALSDVGVNQYAQNSIGASMDYTWDNVDSMLAELSSLTDNLDIKQDIAEFAEAIRDGSLTAKEITITQRQIMSDIIGSQSGGVLDTGAGGMGDMADEFLSLFQQANENPLLFDEEQMLQILYGLQTALSDLGLNTTADLADSILGGVLGPDGLPALPEGFAESLDPAVLDLIDAISAEPQPTPVTMDGALLADLADGFGDQLKTNNKAQADAIGREISDRLASLLARQFGSLADDFARAVGAAVDNAMNGA
jgi:hypothetical protein